MKPRNHYYADRRLTDIARQIWHPHILYPTCPRKTQQNSHHEINSCYTSFRGNTNGNR